MNDWNWLVFGLITWFIMLPLSIWKLIDIIVIVFHHIDVVIK